MTPSLNANAVPLYLQLADLMRQRIVRDVWAVGDKLPSLDALVQEFGVARVTVRQAIELLTRDGLVSPQQGRGTFVTAKPPQVQRLNVQTSLQELADSYRHDRPHIVSIDESCGRAPLREGDGIAAPHYVFMRRVHSKEGQPYAVINLYLDDALFSQAPERFRNETVIPVLLDMNEHLIAQAHQELTLGSADLEVAELLKIPVNAPIAEVRRVFVDRAQRVIYLAQVNYRADFIRLRMALK